MQALYIRANYLSRRSILHNQQVHLEGRYIPPSEFRTKTVNREDFSARLYVSAYDQRLLAGREGQSLRLTGSVRGVFREGGFADYLQRNGFYGVLDLDRIHGGESRAPPEQPGGFSARFRGAIDSWLEGRAEYWPLSVSFLRALLLGERAALRRRLNSYFRRLGIIHLFVISGLHVGFLSWVIIGFLNKYSYTVKLIVITVFLGSYLYFLGWPVPAFRAGLMAWLSVFALMLERKTSSGALFISAVFILVILDPFVFFDPGFHLSVGAVAGLFLIFPYTKVVPDKLSQLFVLGLGAFFGILPAVIYHFGYFPRFGFLFSFIAGLLFLPFLFLLALQLPLMLLHWTFFAGLIEDLFHWLQEGILLLIHFFQPLASAPGGDFWAVALLAVACWLLLDSRVSSYLKSGGFVLFVFLLIFIQLPASGPHITIGKAGQTPFTHLQTGNGRSNYVILPRRIRFDLYEWRQIEQYLGERGVFRLDGLISDYPPEYFKKLDTEYIIENFYPYWQRGGFVEKEGIKFDFDNHRLHSPFGMISYNYPPEISGSYDPDLLVGIFNDETVIINNLDKISRSDYEQLLGGDLDIHLLNRQEFRVE